MDCRHDFSATNIWHGPMCSRCGVPEIYARRKPPTSLGPVERIVREKPKGGYMIQETARDENGNILWKKDYPFSRLFVEGQEQVVDSTAYIVVSCKLVDGEVNTVLKKVSS